MSQHETPRYMNLEGGRHTRRGARLSEATRPLVSVVTVVLNGKEKLSRTVESVLKQTYANIEYIVIDGGSTDGSIDLLRSLDDSIDRWISEPDAGIAAAFNKGIGLANGELVAFLNAGDWYEPEAVAAVCRAYLQHPDSDVVCGAIRLQNPDSSSLVCFSDPSLIEYETSIYHPSVFVKRSSYEKFGGFDERYRYAMDYELLLRFSRLGAKILNIAVIIANMTLDGVSYENWYSGLKEVRSARSQYFPRYEVRYRHWLAVVKNIAARGLKLTGLSNIYRSYWTARNDRLIKQSWPQG
jgi:glycosyltransferase involved in cell wall biosynthesis